LVVGDASTADVASVIDALWSGPESIVIVSTDLSHYHPYRDAVHLDTRTAAAVAARRPDDIADLDACGARPYGGCSSQPPGDTSRSRRSTSGIPATPPATERVVGSGASALA
jgi:AmmeMemoRadiSam system protein B